MILILEGIHALNPALTPNISAANKYKIYVSALTTILLDNHNYIPTTDNRLLRRIIRDYKYRNYSAEETIARWPTYVPERINGFSLTRNMPTPCLTLPCFLNWLYLKRMWNQCYVKFRTAVRNTRRLTACCVSFVFHSRTG